MSLNRTDRRPLREIIYTQLVDDIIRGRINSGEKLVESELAEKFDVSRTPIREALLQLEKEGYTEHVKNVGATVRKISSQKVSEIFGVIAILESEATRMAVENEISKKDLAYLRRLQKDMFRSAKARDFINYNQLNILFHQFFLEQCENETLSGIDRDLRNKMYRMVSEGLSLPMNIERYIKSHDQVLEAVAARKPELAYRWMKEHILEASQALVKMMALRHR